jgi:hypothetical protein
MSQGIHKIINKKFHPAESASGWADAFALRQQRVAA